MAPQLSLDRLLSIRAPFCVTVTVPLRPHDPDRDRVRIELKHAIERADAELTALDVEPADRERTLAPLRALCETRPDVPREGETLLAFLTLENQEIHTVDLSLPAHVAVGDHFALADLAAAQHRSAKFYVLGLSDAGARLLRVNGERVTPVELPLEREDRAAANAERVSPVPGGSLHANRFNRGGGRGGPIVHQQGFGEEDRDAIERDAWYWFVNQALEVYFERIDEPLVLVADVVHHAAFRHVCRVSNLAAEAVQFNPEGADAHTLVARAQAVLAPTDEGGDADARLARAKNRSDDLGAILTAAQNGQVETLFFTAGTRQYGLLDDGHITQHDEHQPGDVELIDEVVRATLVNGGDVVPVSALEPGPVSATLRWA